MEWVKAAGIVGTGGFIGSALRHLITLALANVQATSFPVATYLANVLGSFLMGIVMGIVLRGPASDTMRLFFATGILGGFTTYSAFSFETVRLLAAKQFSAALFYSFATMILALAACIAGLALSGYRVSSP